MAPGIPSAQSSVLAETEQWEIRGFAYPDCSIACGWQSKNALFDLLAVRFSCFVPYRLSQEELFQHRRHDLRDNIMALSFQ